MWRSPKFTVEKKKKKRKQQAEPQRFRLEVRLPSGGKQGMAAAAAGAWHTG